MGRRRETVQGVPKARGVPRKIGVRAWSIRPRTWGYEPVRGLQFAVWGETYHWHRKQQCMFMHNGGVDVLGPGLAWPERERERGRERENEAVGFLQNLNGVTHIKRILASKVVVNDLYDLGDVP